MKSDPSGDRLCLHLPGEERPPGRRGEDEGGSLLWLNQLAGVPQKFLCHLHTGQHINAVTAVLLSWTDNTPGPGRIQWLMVVSAAAGGRNKNTPPDSSGTARPWLKTTAVVVIVVVVLSSQENECVQSECTGKVTKQQPFSDPWISFHSCEEKNSVATKPNMNLRRAGSNKIDQWRQLQFSFLSPNCGSEWLGNLKIISRSKRKSVNFKVRFLFASTFNSNKKM